MKQHRSWFSKGEFAFDFDDYICKCKVYEMKPSIIELIAKIRKYQGNEHYIAKKKVQNR